MDKRPILGMRLEGMLNKINNDAACEMIKTLVIALRHVEYTQGFKDGYIQAFKDFKEEMKDGA